MTRPLALTIGEPAGIGPDITLAAWRSRKELSLPPFYVVANPDFLARRAHLLKIDVKFASVTPETATDAFAGKLPVVPLRTSR